MPNTPKIAYVIAENEVLDAEAYKAYASRVLATLPPFDGVALARAGTSEAWEGKPPDRLVILAFPSIALARSWWNSPAYQEILPLRLKAAKGRVYVAEGIGVLD